MPSTAGALRRKTTKKKYDFESSEDDEPIVAARRPITPTTAKKISFNEPK